MEEKQDAEGYSCWNNTYVRSEDSSDYVPWEGPKDTLSSKLLGTVGDRGISMTQNFRQAAGQG